VGHDPADFPPPLPVDAHYRSRDVIIAGDEGAVAAAAIDQEFLFESLA
jgi:hypothetical protein